MTNLFRMLMVVALVTACGPAPDRRPADVDPEALAKCTENGGGGIDECGRCVGGETGMVACQQDCNGDWGGRAKPHAKCGDACVGGSTGLECRQTACGADEWVVLAEGEQLPECPPVDCAGVIGGTATLDACGVCDSNPQNDC